MYNSAPCCRANAENVLAEGVEAKYVEQTQKFKDGLDKIGSDAEEAVMSNSVAKAKKLGEKLIKDVEVVEK